MSALVLKKCCCYYELRIGLLVWGYLNLLRYTLLDSITTSVYFSRLLILYRDPDLVHLRRTGVIIFLVLCSVALLNLIVNVLFIVAAHKRHVGKLKLALGLCALRLLLDASSLVTGNILYATSEPIAQWMDTYMDLVSYYLIIDNPALATFDIVFHIYILILMRSLYISIRDDSEQRAFLESFDTDGANLSNRNANISFVEIVSPMRRFGDSSHNKSFS